MALTCSQMIDEVQANCGRGGDTVLITDARVTIWINDAQKYIADNCNTIPELQFKNTASMDFTTGFVSYSLLDLTYDVTGDVTTVQLCYLNRAWYIYGAESFELYYLPIDEFDTEYPDPTHADFGTGVPQNCTRRGNNLEIAPRPSTTYNDRTLRVDGMRYAADFATDSGNESEIKNADEGMIYYATSKAWGAIGQEDKSVIWLKKFGIWLDNYKNLTSRLDSWGYNIAYDSGAEE